MRTHGRRWRRRATSSLRRVRSFSAARRSSRASNQCLAACGRYASSSLVSLLARAPVGRGTQPSARRFSCGSDKCVGICMDSLITAAARALAAGDALGALNYVALRDDPPALALRGIAMAQLDDLARAKAAAAARRAAFGPRESGRSRALRDRRSRDRAGLARSRLARKGARHGGTGARSATATAPTPRMRAISQGAATCC